MNTPEEAEIEETQVKVLTAEEKETLERQNSRLVSEFQALKLEQNAKKNWDLFYKRNENRFFKDRHWTTREFDALNRIKNENIVLLETGCGVGNFFYPLLEESKNLFVYACDFSPRAVELVRSDSRFDDARLKAFQADLTVDKLTDNVTPASVDLVTMIFVLSAIHPDKFSIVLENIHSTLKPGGSILFRDYGLYDMAQLRFKPGHKIANNFYMRQDGTRSYYFSVESLCDILTASGFETVTAGYVHRRTVNLKDNIDVPRIFLQAEFKKKTTLKDD